ncbi:PTH11 GPCR protein [Penicillium digitatum]|uniref:PTH11 GPCR protein n=1 Tax=Penicillium digitatum TaxID=36651 RepID=A0A7T7BPR2_PENDI|nr:PTH11 GPCR protein [Penicillium digitatum]
MSTSLADLSLTAEERYMQSLIYGLITSTGILSMIVCSLRLYTRAFVIKVFGLDDIAVCVALIITQAFNGLGIAIVYYGEGIHFNKLSPEDRAMWIKLYYVAMCLYLYASLSVKISLLLFLRRIFIKSWMNFLTMGLIIFQVVFSVTGSFVLAFQCDPPRAAYDLSIRNPKCYSQYKLFQITLYEAVLIFLCDVIILIAPLVVLCGLNMPTRKILALMVIFGSGIIACISPVVRFSTLDYLRNGTTDLSYKSASSLYWMAIEFNLGLVAGSLSSLRPLPIFRRFGSSTNSRDKISTGDKSHELHDMNGSEPRVARKKTFSLGMGTTLLQDTVNESQENIIHAPKGDYEQGHARV